MIPRIYLDYAATTPVDSAVLAVMKPYFNKRFGNASSLHSWGQEAMAALDEAREKITKAIGADFREIIFTGSATEANNLALRGVVKKYISENQPKISVNQRPRLIISAIEHESILENARDLEKDGVEVVYLPVDHEGIVDLKKLRAALNERTILVSIMYANNEIGTIEPIAKISSIINKFKKPKTNYHLPSANYPLFHTDVAQAFQYLDCNVNKLGVDLMTLSAHKIYGPKGIGALYVRKLKTKNSKLKAIITGGGQEFGLRSGTENIPSVVGFAKAVELVSNSRELENERISKLRDYFWKEIKKVYPRAQLNGSAISINQRSYQHKSVRLPNNLNVYFPGHKVEDLLIKFDLAGVAVSAGSACSARGTEPSHVLKACGFPLERIKSSLRITLGRPTTKAEIEEAIKRIKKILSS